MNLLPPHYKASLRLEAWRRFLVFFGTYLSIIGVGAVMLLLPSYFFLQFQIGNLQLIAQTLQGTPEYKNMEEGQKTVGRIRRLLTSTQQFFASDAIVTPLLEDTIARMPASVSLTEFTYAREGDKGTLRLAGFAGHRDDLTLFVETLQKSAYVKEKIVIPESSFLREFNTSFVLLLVIGPR